MKSTPAEPILRVEDLRVEFPVREGIARAVNGVDFNVQPGETVALVGESGSGKSVTAMSILRLLDRNARITGRVEFDGTDLMKLSEREMQCVRGDAVSMIFQDPMASLNPLFPVGLQIAESLRLHEGTGKRASMERAVEMLAQVGISEPRRRAGQYPHELSGGMCQRIMIAMALASDPRLLIADEPTTALDVTIQAQILELLRSLARKHGSAVLLVTHDLGVVREFASRVLVMYAGRIVEQGDTATLFRDPKHPYTRGLMGAVPPPVQESVKGRRLIEIPGSVPSSKALIDGCAFERRCSRATEVCRTTRPSLVGHGGSQAAACHHPLNAKDAAWQ